MQIIDGMPSEQFEDICDAGVELVQKLIAVLKSRGLGLEHAAAVIAVAAAGVTKGSKLDSDNIAEMIESVIHMWRIEKREGENGIIFDPAHRRPGFVPAESKSLGN